MNTELQMLLHDLAAEARGEAWGEKEYLAACDALERGDVIPPAELLVPEMLPEVGSSITEHVAKACAEWAIAELRIREAKAAQRNLKRRTADLLKGLRDWTAEEIAATKATAEQMVGAEPKRRRKAA